MIALDPPTMLILQPRDIIAQFELSFQHCCRVMKAKRCEPSAILSAVVYVVGADAIEVARHTAERLLPIGTPILFVPTRRLPRDSIVELQIVSVTRDEIPSDISYSETALSGRNDQEGVIQLNCAQTENCSAVHSSVLFDAADMTSCVQDVAALFSSINDHPSCNWDHLVYLRVFCPAPIIKDVRELWNEATSTSLGVQRKLAASFIPLLAPALASSSRLPQSMAVTALFSNCG
jgi:enamine deaminase RidA (YjgF/YER057c/UK114 family)